MNDHFDFSPMDLQKKDMQTSAHTHTHAHIQSIIHLVYVHISCRGDIRAHSQNAFLKHKSSCDHSAHHFFTFDFTWLWDPIFVFFVDDDCEFMGILHVDKQYERVNGQIHQQNCFSQLFPAYCISLSVTLIKLQQQLPSPSISFHWLLKIGIDTIFGLLLTSFDGMFSQRVRCYMKAFRT